MLLSKRGNDVRWKRVWTSRRLGEEEGSLVGFEDEDRLSFQSEINRDCGHRPALAWSFIENLADLNPRSSAPPAGHFELPLTQATITPSDARRYWKRLLVRQAAWRQRQAGPK